jgi:hypothetical protein
MWSCHLQQTSPVLAVIDYVDCDVTTVHHLSCLAQLHISSNCHSSVSIRETSYENRCCSNGFHRIQHQCHGIFGERMILLFSRRTTDICLFWFSFFVPISVIIDANFIENTATVDMGQQCHSCIANLPRRAPSRSSFTAKLHIFCRETK